MPDPPKFSGKGSKLTLDQWTQQFGIWLRYQQFTDDNAKIMAALMFLEGGPLSYMSEYAVRAGNGQDLGTWNDFIQRL